MVSASEEGKDDDDRRRRTAEKWLRMTRTESIVRDKSVYEALSRTVSKKYATQIDRDVCRTFPMYPYFRKGGKGEASMRRVLNAYANYNAKIGYVQGMNMLVAYLIRRTGDEEAAFWIFVSMMHSSKYDILGLFTNDFPKMHCAAYQIDRLLIRKKKRLHAHLRALKVEPTMYMCKWLLQLYTNLLPDQALDLVWEGFLDSGWSYLMQVTYSILDSVEDEVTKRAEFYEVASFLTATMWKSSESLLCAVRLARSQPVTAMELKQLELEYLLKVSSIRSADVLSHEAAAKSTKERSRTEKKGVGDMLGDMDWAFVGKIAAAGALAATVAVAAAARKPRR